MGPPQDSYELLGIRVRVRTAHEEFARALRWHLEPFRSGDSGRYSMMVEVTELSDGRLRYEGKGVDARSGSASLILRHALWDIHGHVHRDVSDYLFLHAGAVARDGAAVLLPAEMEVGKTTLTAAMLRAGFDYLSDELGVIDPADASAHPFPKRLTLEPDSLRFLPGLEERLTDRDGLNAALRQRYATPSDLGSSVGARSEVHRIAFIGVDRVGPPRLTRLSSGEAVAELSRHCFNLRLHGARGLAVLVKIARGADAYRVEGGTPLERASVIADSLP